MPVYTVSQLTSYLKALVEQDPLIQDIWVSGEVSNLARPGSGHTYFTLRDSNRSIRCVMFRNVRGAERLEGGAAVIAHGRISVYEVRGEVQLIVDIVQPEGVGELQLKLEQLKLKLEKEGLFEPSRKRPIPEFPRRVAVITSPSGAVWQDIQTIISRRYPLVELMLVPTPVQGEDAAPGIVEAFKALNAEAEVDTVILARGGGSLEDLWPFNEEAVARAIYSSPAPVISAVGHETDYTISDLVADQRAPTPSAAAEVAVPERSELTTRMLVAEQALGASISGHLSIKRDRFEQHDLRLRRSSPDLDTLSLRVDDLLASATSHLRHNREVIAERFEGLRLRLSTLSPTDTLRRGYAIVQKRDDAAIVNDADQVMAGEVVDVTLSRGALEAKVTSTHTNHDVQSNE